MRPRLVSPLEVLGFAHLNSRISKGAFTLTNQAIGRVDFHLHSSASNVTDYYAANAFAIPGLDEALIFVKDVG
jgi:hypothetical protein